MLASLTRLWCRHFALALCCCAALAEPALAQIQPPLRNRPLDYSGAVGAYTIRRTAAPTEVIVEEPIVLTVFITGSAYKGKEPQRELLKLFPPEMDKDFFIEPLPEKDRYDAKEQTWEFVYHLRPKHLDVKSVPNLRFVHFNPTLDKDRCQPAQTRGVIPLVVKARPTGDAVETEPLVIPPGFETLETGPEVLRPWSPPFWTTPLGMALLFGGPVLGCAGCYLVWQRGHPDAAKLARLRQSQAARKALGALQGMTHGVDGERIAAILAEYVQDRLEMPTREPTAEEVAEALRRKRTSPKVIQMARTVFHDIDALRFGQTAARATGLNAKELTTFIGTLEESLWPSSKS